MLERWCRSWRSTLRAALDARTSFAPTHHVWSRGLALCCDHHGGAAYVKSQRSGTRVTRPLDPRRYRVRAGDLVWIRAIALPQFLDQVLPRIDAPFGLLTGDEDWTMPRDFARARELLDDPRVLVWYAQNHDGSHPDRMRPLPIGLDFHTISNRRKWGQWPASPQAQEDELKELVAAAPPVEARALRVHADFHFNMHRAPRWGEHRRSVARLLRRNPCVDFQPRRVPRRALWAEKTRYAFVVSPHGNGMDCHRTWESLALGNIVLAKRSPLDPLYEGLAVQSVDRWDEITPENLSRWLRELAPRTRDPASRERLTNAYWIAQARAEVRRRM